MAACSRVRGVAACSCLVGCARFACGAGIAGGANVILIPEVEFDLDRVNHREVPDAQEAEHEPEVPSYQMFDSPRGRCYADSSLRCPSGVAGQSGNRGVGSRGA